MRNAIVKTGFYRSSLRVAGILIAVLLLWAAWINARRASSFELSRRVQPDENGLTSLNRAIQINPSDARAYVVRARSLQRMGRITEAVRDLEMAVSLRPHDYLLRLRLGHACQRLGEYQRALATYQQAVQLAPSYALCHWHIARVLQKIGNKREAFSEFRLATRSDPGLFERVVGYAWKAFGEDTVAVTQAVAPETPTENLALARSFLQHGKVSNALQLYRVSTGISDTDRQAFVAQLIKAHAYEEAFEIWTTNRGAGDGGREALTNANFETDIDPAATGFEWQISPSLRRVRAVRDFRAPHAGKSCLRVDFNGNSNPVETIVSQIIVVKPGVGYRLLFFARARNLVSGGLPFLAITDAANGLVLGRSKPVAANIEGWEGNTIEFKADDSTHAIVINLRRENCSTQPCPAFGSLWLDSFSIEVAE